MVRAFCCREYVVSLAVMCLPCRSCGRTPQYEPPLPVFDWE
jgi:hypothetical protein